MAESLTSCMRLSLVILVCVGRSGSYPGGRGGGAGPWIQARAAYRPPVMAPRVQSAYRPPVMAHAPRVQSGRIGMSSYNTVSRRIPTPGMAYAPRVPSAQIGKMTSYNTVGRRVPTPPKVLAAPTPSAKAPVAASLPKGVRPRDQNKVLRPVSRPSSGQQGSVTPRPSRHRPHGSATGKPGSRRPHKHPRPPRRPRPLVNPLLIYSGPVNVGRWSNSPFLYDQSVSMFAPMVDRPGYWGLDYEPTHNSICGNGELTCSSGQLCPETCRCAANEMSGANAAFLTVVVGSKKEGRCAPDPSYKSREARLRLGLRRRKENPSE